MSDALERLRRAIVEKRPKEVEGLVRVAVAAGEPLDRIMNDAMIGAMDEVGRRFASGEIFVPEMLVSAHAMKLALGVVRPLLQAEGVPARGTVLMGTVKGDLHDIGKNVVVMMLEGAGFRVVDLGVDLTVERVVDEVEVQRPDVLGLSALLTTTMPEMEKVLDALAAKGLRDRVRVMVGGAPVDAAFAEAIGADGYGQDAAEAVGLARRLAAR